MSLYCQRVTLISNRMIYVLTYLSRLWWLIVHTEYARTMCTQLDFTLSRLSHRHTLYTLACMHISSWFVFSLSRHGIYRIILREKPSAPFTDRHVCLRFACRSKTGVRETISGFHSPICANNLYIYVKAVFFRKGK